MSNLFDTNFENLFSLGGGNSGLPNHLGTDFGCHRSSLQNVFLLQNVPKLVLSAFNETKSQLCAHYSSFVPNTVDNVLPILVPNNGAYFNQNGQPQPYCSSDVTLSSLPSRTISSWNEYFRRSFSKPKVTCSCRHFCNPEIVVEESQLGAFFKALENRDYLMVGAALAKMNGYSSDSPFFLNTAKSLINLLMRVKSVGNVLSYPQLLPYFYFACQRNLYLTSKCTNSFIYSGPLSESDHDILYVGMTLKHFCEVLTFKVTKTGPFSDYKKSVIKSLCLDMLWYDYESADHPRHVFDTTHPLSVVLNDFFCLMIPGWKQLFFFLTYQKTSFTVDSDYCVLQSLSDKPVNILPVLWGSISEKIVPQLEFLYFPSNTLKREKMLKKLTNITVKELAYLEDKLYTPVYELTVSSSFTFLQKSGFFSSNIELLSAFYLSKRCMLPNRFDEPVFSTSVNDLYKYLSHSFDNDAMLQFIDDDIFPPILPTVLLDDHLVSPSFVCPSKPLYQQLLTVVNNVSSFLFIIYYSCTGRIPLSATALYRSKHWILAKYLDLVLVCSKCTNIVRSCICCCRVCWKFRSDENCCVGLAPKTYCMDPKKYMDLLEISLSSQE
jgi:hypothetical protein